jgi:multisubunit Na+/H+ antiporter MnhB subunit
MSEPTGTTGIVALVAATAVISLPPMENAVYGLVGALVGVLTMLVALISGTRRLTRKDWSLFVVNALSSVFVGVVVAVIGTPVLPAVLAIFFTELSERVTSDATLHIAHLTALTLGLLAWRLVPIFIDKATNKAKEAAL